MGQIGQEEARKARAEEYVAEAYAAPRAPEDEHLCSRCGAPLRIAREQSARLCGWCEESIGGKD